MSSRMGDQTVMCLLVEDDDVDVMSVERAFRDLRIVNPLAVARDGIEALECLRGQHPDITVRKPYLILLDLNMPRMNGFEFLKALREDPEHRDAVVFVLTTSKRDEDIVAAYDKHVAGYIVKSEDMQDGLRKAFEMIDKYWRIVEFPLR